MLEALLRPLVVLASAAAIGAQQPSKPAAAAKRATHRLEFLHQDCY